MASSLSLRGILDTNKLTGPNYIDWLRNLRIIFTQEKVSNIMDTPTPDSLGEDASEEERATYKMWKMIVWLSNASCLSPWAMSFRGSMRIWMFPLYSLIIRSYMENKVELLDMRYQSSCSMLAWLKAPPYKCISWRWLIWSLVWDSWALPWMVNWIKIWSCSLSLTFFLS